MIGSKRLFLFVVFHVFFVCLSTCRGSQEIDSNSRREKWVVFEGVARQLNTVDETKYFIRNIQNITEFACNPFVPRENPLELVIGPHGLEKKILSKIATAENEILVMMYQFTPGNISNALINAYQRGVKIKVLFDGKQEMNNSTISQLNAAGLQTRITSKQFNHAHAKVMLIDGIQMLIMSGNFNTYTMNSERNYGVFIYDTQDIKDMKKLFQHDWNKSDDLDLSCTRLLISPINARTHILDLINRANQRLNMEVMYITDKEVLKAIKDKTDMGVEVRVLLAHPSWIKSNYKTAKELALNNISVKYFDAYDLHAKVVIADDMALVGSHNLSSTSIEKNREVGVVVNHEATVKLIQSQFLADWNIGLKP